MAPRTIYANLQDGLQPFSLWDQSLADMGNLGIIPCTAVGANAVILTPIASVFPPNTQIPPQALQAFSFVAAANSTGPITIKADGNAALKLYKMDGVTQATTGDLTATVTYIVNFNAALNSNAGGFQILAPISNEINPIISGATITNSTYNGNTWTAGTGTLTLGSNTLTVSNTGTAVTSASAAGGGLAGTYPNPTVASVPSTAMPALTGDVTTSAGAVATTLATVNSNIGTFGSATLAPVITVNGKGLVTAVTTNAIRQILSANITYAVSKTGNDSNAGTSTSSATVTFTNSSSNIGWPSHGLSVGNNFMLSTSGSLPTNFDSASLYYVKTVVDANTIVAALTSGGTAITAGSAGSGTQTATVFSPFLTIQKAINTIGGVIDHNGFSSLVQVGGGSYPENLVTRTYVGRGTQGHTTPLIQGAFSDHTLVKINPGSGTCISGVTQSYCEWTFKNLEVDATSATGIVSDAGSWLCIDGLVFGGTATTHMVAEDFGILEILSNYTITAGAQIHVTSLTNGLVLYSSNTITLSGTPAFSSAFAYVDYNSLINAVGCTFSGAATGTRYLQGHGGRFNLGGTDPNSMFPGNANGSFASQEPGTGTNDAASAGNIGEYISATVLTGSAVSLTTATVANVTSISLTPGDWDVTIQGYFNSGSTVITVAYVTMGTTNSELNQTAGRFSTVQSGGTNSQTLGCNAGPFRLSLSATTSVFFNAYSAFSASTLSAWGIIRARRVR